MNSLKRQLIHNNNKNKSFMFLQQRLTESSSSCCSMHYPSNNNNKNNSRSCSSSTSSSTNKPYGTVCFIRHGQSTWNRDNRFIGWTDTPLTENGMHEAQIAGRMLHDANIVWDEVHTSWLRRSIKTADIVLQEMQQEYIPVYKSWRLNERNYGDLVGYEKKEMVRQYGVDQIKRWRRSYDTPPPPMSPDHKYHPKNDTKYKHMVDQIPSSESLKCTMERSSVYWKEAIEPSLRLGRAVLIVGHENNLRSILMKLEGIAPEDIINLSVPRAVPLLYRLDPVTMAPINPRVDGSLDSATGYLRGTWLGGDTNVSKILHRDEKQVYDTSITHNLELPMSRKNINNNNNAWIPGSVLQTLHNNSHTNNIIHGSNNNNSMNGHYHHHHRKQHQQEQQRAA